MMHKELIQIVASVDVLAGTGKFLYVNPTTAAAAVSEPAAAGAAPPDGGSRGTGFELVVQAADGRELQRLRPAILLPSDQDAPTAALIDQSIARVEGMARLVLLHDNQVVATFEAGLQQLDVPEALAMDAGPPGRPDKRSLSLAIEAEPGVTYTIQVRAAGERAWQTIAVGQKSPKAVLDRNQFPGAERVVVRVLRSTGFEDRVVAEHEADLRFQD